MPDDPTPPSAPSADRLQRWHVEHLMAAAEPHVLTNPAAAAMLGWLAVTLSVIEQRDAAESRSAEDRSDTERLDWLESWTKGDQGICPPGNHGGSATNWLVFREDDSRSDRLGRWTEEAEGVTLREAIDAARTASPRESHE